MIQCRFEHGADANLRHAVVTVLAFKGSKLMFVKRADTFDGKSLVEGGKDCLPGGYVERDETTRQAAMREFEQETGFLFKNAVLFAINDNPERRGDTRQNVDFVFIGQVGKRVGKPDSETAEIKLFELTNLPSEAKIAFDHVDYIKLFIRHLENRFSLPIVMTQR